MTSLYFFYLDKIIVICYNIPPNILGGMTMNEKIMKQFGFGDELAAVKAGLCPFCRKPINADDFKDSLSLKEFYISGLCMACQNEVFGGDE